MVLASSQVVLTADTSKNIGEKSVEGAKKVGAKTAEGAKKAGKAVKKVIP